MEGKDVAMQRQVVERALITTAAASLTINNLVVHAYAGSVAYALTLPNVAAARGKTVTIYGVDDLSIYNVTIQDNNESLGWTDIVLNAAAEAVIMYSDGIRWWTTTYNVS